MENRDKIILGLEKAYLKLIEFKKYKNSPIITSKNGKIVEISPDKIKPAIYIHK
ncbi:MAG: hypothetical protein P4L34_09855 [Paludibacter sp.]|nr:hypothetical protein [Paludibacter sp.]